MEIIQSATKDFILYLRKELHEVVEAASIGRRFIRRLISK